MRLVVIDARVDDADGGVCKRLAALKRCLGTGGATVRGEPHLTQIGPLFADEIVLCHAGDANDRDRNAEELFKHGRTIFFSGSGIAKDEWSGRIHKPTVCWFRGSVGSDGSASWCLEDYLRAVDANEDHATCDAALHGIELQLENRLEFLYSCLKNEDAAMRAKEQLQQKDGIDVDAITIATLLIDHVKLKELRDKWFSPFP